MKKIISSVILAALLLSTAVYMFTSPANTSTVAAVSNDPADSYTPLTAAYEDSTLSIWFEHVTEKVTTKDIVPSGRNTYSVYMAKNEIQNAQFVLYSQTAKTGMTASVTAFSNGNGATIPAEIYKEMYVDINLGEEIGSQPDAIPALGTDTFDLTADETQAFLIKLRTATDTPAGWYSATLSIYNSSRQEVKKVTVFAKVWDFEISEETPVQTAIYLDYSRLNGYRPSGVTQAQTYTDYYNYMLENRICAFNMPSAPYSSKGTTFLNNPRVTAYRIGDFGYPHSTYSSSTDTYTFTNSYADDILAFLYTKIKDNPDWYDKGYFYTVDEPMPKAFIGNPNRGNCLDAMLLSKTQIDAVWPNSYFMNVMHENYPSDYGDTVNPELDAVGFLLDFATVWCVKPYAYMPASLLNVVPNSRTQNGTISSFGLPAGVTADWDAMFGEFSTRINNKVAAAALEGQDIKEWWYCAGSNGGTNCSNILIENDGIMHEMLFWQMKQYDITGLLYYYANLWNGGAEYTNVGTSNYGDGILLYPGTVLGKTTPVGSLRMELMRDGIEEYEMLNMYESTAGDAALQSLIATVSTNVVQYTLDDDLMAEKRIFLGNEIERLGSACVEHTWDSGVQTTAPSATTEGVMTYTCTVCGETRTEAIAPLGYSKGDVNGDEKVNSGDILELRLHVAGSTTITDQFKLSAADVDSDDKVNSSDILALRLLIV